MISVKRLLVYSVLLFGFFLITKKVFSQLSVRQKPVSYREKLSADDLPIIKMASFDLTSMIKEDEENSKNGLIPLRFANEFVVDYEIKNVGNKHTLEDGSSLWRIKVSSEGAFSLHFVFNSFKLPTGALLFIYDEGYNNILGAFTNQNNKSSGVLATAEIPGDKVIIEYFEPNNAEFAGVLELRKVYHAYRDLFKTNKDSYFGNSGGCNIDVLCDDASDWKAEKQAVCRLKMGNSLCSGSLVNNTANDGKPYFLTAQHCIGNSTLSEWVFYFNYESPSCNGTDGSVNQTLSGCELKATADSLDFCLVEMDDAPPFDYQPYFLGWNNSGDIPNNTFTIHHPSGDVKKFTTDVDPPASDTYSTGQYGINSHWHIYAWDLGTTEGGSSGGPLFDQNHRVVGSLTGGDANCNNNVNDYFARFDICWDQYSDSARQLKYWLDPLNTGVSTLSFYDPYGVDDGCDSLTNFTGYPTLYNSMNGGFLSGNNNHGDICKAEFFENSNSTISINGAYIKFGYAVGAGSDISVSVCSETNSKPGSMLSEETIPLTSIIDDVANESLTYIEFDPPVQVNGNYFVVVELPSQSGDTVAIFTNSENDASNNTAWEKGSDNVWKSYTNSWGITLNHYIVVTSCIATGIEPVLEINNQLIQLFPNPASDEVIIKGDFDLNSIISVEIHDLYGRNIMTANEFKDNFIVLDVSLLREGIYFVQMNFKSEKITKKLLIIQ